MLPIWFVFHCILNWFVVGQNTVSALYQLYLSLQVDGLIKLMNGNNTGPINLGNPGKIHLYFSLLLLHSELLNLRYHIIHSYGYQVGSHLSAKWLQLVPQANSPCWNLLRM